ncbi:MAG: glycoside hydrolase family 113 [Adhaeribacter sp.]
MIKRLALLACLAMLALFSGHVFRQNSSRPAPGREGAGPLPALPAKTKMRGVSWVAGDSVTEDQVAGLKARHINWISQTPFGWQAAYNQPEIRLNTRSSRVYWGESDQGLVYTTRLAKKHGIKTLLKPHLWLRDRSGKWLGDIEMSDEETWKTWFRNYRTFILHYARLAEQEQIEALCIGTELHKAAVSREQDWRRLIADIRLVYSGQLTYAANWYLEYEQVRFWDALDFIGVQAYFPLTKNHHPSLAELKKGWKAHLPDLARLARRYQKPLVFTEAGYKSSPDAGIEPWAWPKRGVASPDQVSEQTQANCYQALFLSVWDQPWFSGIFIWKWYPQVRNNGRDHHDFTPQHKPAEKILSQWYSKQ